MRNSQSAHETMEHASDDHKRSYGQVDESTAEKRRLLATDQRVVVIAMASKEGGISASELCLCACADWAGQTHKASEKSILAALR